MHQSFFHGYLFRILPTGSNKSSRCGFHMWILRCSAQKHRRSRWWKERYPDAAGGTHRSCNEKCKRGSESWSTGETDTQKSKKRRNTGYSRRKRSDSSRTGIRQWNRWFYSYRGSSFRKNRTSYWVVRQIWGYQSRNTGSGTDTCPQIPTTPAARSKSEV